MNLSLIEAFGSVMKTGSTTRAADLLGISQPSISRSLKRLEDTTKLKLFERSGPRLTPTPEAHVLYREIIDTHVGLERLRQTVARIRAVGTGSLRIASSAALGMAFIPKVLKLFLEQRPGISVTFEIANSSAVRNLVSSGTYDIGFCADEIDRSNLVSEFFSETMGVCVMSADHPLVQASTVTPAMLDGKSMISLSPDDKARAQFDQVMEEANVKSHILVETQFAATICQLALEGVGVGIANSLAYVSGQYETLGLVARPFRPAIAFRSLMILPPHRTRSSLVVDLVSLLSSERDAMVAICEDRFG